VVSATNLGRRPVSLKAWALEVEEGYRIIDTGRLPHKLEDGESFTDCLVEFEGLFSRPVKSLAFFDLCDRGGVLNGRIFDGYCPMQAMADRASEDPNP
jgi:hypothetical protein